VRSQDQDGTAIERRRSSLSLSVIYLSPIGARPGVPDGIRIFALLLLRLLHNPVGTLQHDY
jgi:hypothetical protein